MHHGQNEAAYKQRFTRTGGSPGSSGWHLPGAVFSLLLFSLFLTTPAFSRNAIRAVRTQGSLRLVMDNDYVAGKVNDPVSKKAKDAYIVCENPLFHLEAGAGVSQDVEIVVYANEYVEGQDKGVRNRIVKKTVATEEQVQLLPDETYERCFADGSLYDFANRCYVVRVYTGENEQAYEDYYFGLVEDEMFMEMSNSALPEDEEEAPEEPEDERKAPKAGRTETKEEETASLSDEGVPMTGGGIQDAVELEDQKPSQEAETRSEDGIVVIDG